MCDPSSPPRPGIKATPPAVEERSLNHWTAGGVPLFVFSTAVLTRQHQCQQLRSRLSHLKADPVPRLGS